MEAIKHQAWESEVLQDSYPILEYHRYPMQL